MLACGLPAACRPAGSSDEGGATPPATTGTSPVASAGPGPEDPTSPVDAPHATSQVNVPGLRVTSGTLGPGAAWGYTELSLDPTAVRLEAVGLGGPHQLDRLLTGEALAVVNGGYFEADYRPTAWLVSGGVERAARVNSGRGGVLALDRAGTAYVGPLSSLGFAPEFAVQSSPLIVEPGSAPGILRDDGKRAARNVACVGGRGVAAALRFILIVAPRGEGPTLYEAMALLREAPPRGFGCTAALNLDGGPSVGVVYGRGVAARPRSPVAPIGYGIAIVPRGPGGGAVSL